MRPLVPGCLAAAMLATCAGLLALPKRYEVVRSVVVEAPREAVHRVLAEPRRWPEWFPWGAGSASFSGPPSGVDSRIDWAAPGAPDGVAALVVTACDAERGVWAELVRGRGRVRYAILYGAAGEGATEVTWYAACNVEGPSDRLFALVAESLVGPDLERGLAALKDLVERD